MVVEEIKLKKELDLFEREKTNLICKFGQDKFVIICDDNILGPYDDENMAYAEGIKNFGIKPFLIQRIIEQSPIERIPALILGVIHAC